MHTLGQVYEQAFFIRLWPAGLLCSSDLGRLGELFCDGSELNYGVYIGVGVTWMDGGREQFAKWSPLWTLKYVLDTLFGSF